MTAVYEKLGVQFLYPENWKVSEDGVRNLPRTISIESPTGAFWSVDIHPLSVDIQTLLDEILQAMQQEHDDVEFTKVDEDSSGEAVRGYDLEFFCLDFVVKCQLRAFPHDHAVYLMTYQAEDRDYPQLSQVFLAITHSLLTEKSLSQAE